MDAATLAETLTSSSLLAGCSAEELADIAARGAVRTFKLERIVSATPTGEPVEERPEIDVDELFESSVKTWSGDRITVRIRIVAAAAWALREYPLVGSQHVVHEPDGSAILEAEVFGLVEVSRWVLRWGKNAEALSPPALREAIRAELEGALSAYREPRRDQSRAHMVSGPDDAPPAAPPSTSSRSTARTTQVREKRRTR